VGIFDELFNPSARFREEERNRNEWLKDDEGEGDPHRGPIDLESGTVRIAAPKPAPSANAGDGGPADAVKPPKTAK
jgi:hypothetical protein